MFFRSPALNGKIVSEDGTAAMIVTMFKEDHFNMQRQFKVLRSPSGPLLG